jgi:hypothetical protein
MILHKANDVTAFFWCPGCDEAHQIIYAGPKAWGFNGDWDKPTFTPSYLTWHDPNPEADPKYDSKGKFRNGFRCHSFITDGNIAFLGDCTHALANQTVALPEWPI